LLVLNIVLISFFFVSHARFEQIKLKRARRDGLMSLVPMDFKLDIFEMPNDVAWFVRMDGSKAAERLIGSQHSRVAY
jgi:hypothetical protein